jgi:hypothetical protein
MPQTPAASRERIGRIRLGLLSAAEPEIQLVPRLRLKNENAGSSRAGTLQLIEDGQHVRRLRPARIVRIDFRIGDDTVLPDHVSRRHRQRPTILAIEGDEVGAELLVDRLQVFGQVPADSEFRG